MLDVYHREMDTTDCLVCQEYIPLIHENTNELHKLETKLAGALLREAPLKKELQASQKELLAQQRLYTEHAEKHDSLGEEYRQMKKKNKIISARISELVAENPTTRSIPGIERILTIRDINEISAEEAKSIDYHTFMSITSRFRESEVINHLKHHHEGNLESYYRIMENITSKGYAKMFQEIKTILVESIPMHIKNLNISINWDEDSNLWFYKTGNNFQCCEKKWGVERSIERMYNLFRGKSHELESPSGNKTLQDTLRCEALAVVKVLSVVKDNHKLLESI